MKRAPCIASLRTYAYRQEPSQIGQRNRPGYIFHVKASFEKAIMNTPAMADAQKKGQPYFLVNNDDEFECLNGQHRAYTLALGALYPGVDVVRAVLAPVEGKTRNILDIGCGSGIWCVEMAREFAHAEITGIDISPPSPPNIPSNCTFLRVDVNHGLSDHYGKYDLIHLRLVSMGFKDFRKSKAEIEQCLKPGGIVIWVEGDYDLLENDMASYSPPAWEGNLDGSWQSRLTFEMHRVAESMNGSDLTTMMEMLNGGLWEDELLDPETCGAGTLFLPLGPWPNDEDPLQEEKLKRVGQLMGENYMTVHKRFHPLLMKAGYERDELSEWSRKADEELKSLSKPTCLRVILAWGRRRAMPGEPAPPLPTVQTPTTKEEEKYRYMHLFENREQGPEEQKARDKSRTRSVPPMPNAS